MDEKMEEFYEAYCKGCLREYRCHRDCNYCQEYEEALLEE